jgi:hypothetical protein
MAVGRWRVTSDSDPFERVERARQRRTAWIERFVERQREAREWVSFWEVAEWCSEEDSIEPNENKREWAFKKLRDDLLDGVFEENGVSRVHFLHPSTVKRVTAEWLKEAIRDNLDSERGRLILEHCWFPRRMLERWLVRHRLPASPARFEPANKSTQPARAQQRPREKRRPSLERAQVAIKAAYPNGVSDQATEPNKNLCQRVSEKLTGPKVSDDTILRAAGRRK